MILTWTSLRNFVTSKSQSGLCNSGHTGITPLPLDRMHRMINCIDSKNSSKTVWNKLGISQILSNRWDYSSCLRLHWDSSNDIRTPLSSGVNKSYTRFQEQKKILVAILGKFTPLRRSLTPSPKTTSTSTRPPSKYSRPPTLSNWTSARSRSSSPYSDIWKHLIKNSASRYCAGRSWIPH